jgi:hypothetical protein
MPALLAHDLWAPDSTTQRVLGEHEPQFLGLGRVERPGLPLGSELDSLMQFGDRRFPPHTVRGHHRRAEYSGDCSSPGTMPDS